MARVIDMPRGPSLGLGVGSGVQSFTEGEGIKPVNIEVKRAPVLKLDTRRPVSEALNESHGVPNGRLQPPKTESISKPKPAPRRAMRKS